MTASSRFVLSAGLVIAGALAVTAWAAPAFAGSDAADRAAAIQACRTRVAEELRIEPALVRLEKIKTRPRAIELRVEARRDGARLAQADCTYLRRGGEVNVVMTPPLGQRAGL